jgi:hypothetical protein
LPLVFLPSFNRSALRSRETFMGDHDWSKPKAVAIPKEGYFTRE